MSRNLDILAKAEFISKQIEQENIEARRDAARKATEDQMAADRQAGWRRSCHTCHTEFLIQEGERTYYKARKLKLPHRCRICRKNAKVQRGEK